MYKYQKVSNTTHLYLIEMWYHTQARISLTRAPVLHYKKKINFFKQTFLSSAFLFSQKTHKHTPFLSPFLVSTLQILRVAF